MTTDLSKQEYLKRYLEHGKGGDKTKRRKLKSSNSHISRIKILDENIDLKSIKFGEKDLDDEEDEPVVAEIIDERPLEVKIKELYDVSRWKKVGSDAEATDARKIDNDDATPRKFCRNQDDSDPSDSFLSSVKKTIRHKSRHDSDSDISIPRRNSERNSDSDILSSRSDHKGINKSRSSETCTKKNHPVRNRNEEKSSYKISKEEKQRKSRHDSDSDISPPRKHAQRGGNDSDSDMSVQRNHATSKSSNHMKSLNLHEKKFSQEIKRHDSDSDISPPRNKNSFLSRKKPDSDISPPKKQHSVPSRKNSDSDISPPRNQYSNIKRENKKSCSDISSLRVKRKDCNQGHQGSDSDDCNVDKRAKKIESKNSEKTYGRRLNDLEKLKCQHNSESMKKKERHHNSDSDFSPSRTNSSRNMEKLSSKDRRNRPEKTLLGLKAGLQNASTLRKETQELREREKKHINKLSDNLSGRNVDTIVRDRQTGMKRDLQAERLVKDTEEKKNVEHQKKYMEWGKGVEQTENLQKKLEDDLYEMSKPLARYCDDEDLEERLKSAIHEEDPMAEYIRKKRRKNEPAVPSYCGPAPPPNRFGIQPGYRWDGVDRSNGFEKKYFEKNNASKATQEEAYLWSVQDM